MFDIAFCVTQKFCQLEKSSDNISFIEQCTIYKALQDMNERKNVAKEIQVNFLMPDSVTAIGVPDTMKREVIAQFAKEEYTDNVLNQIEAEVKIASLDSFARFKNSLLFPG